MFEQTRAALVPLVQVHKSTLLGNFSGWPTSLWHGTKVPLKDHVSLGDSFAAGRGGLRAHPTLAQPELPPVCRSQQAVGAVSGR